MSGLRRQFDVERIRRRGFEDGLEGRPESYVSPGKTAEEQLAYMEARERGSKTRFAKELGPAPDAPIQPSESDLRAKLAERVKAELRSESDENTSLAGPLGEAIATISGSYSLEFITPEQVAEGIAAWLEAEA